ncbi:Ndr [Aphelenchoides avenae]|nr:Ndr [Aphelenchus avenae]
MDVLLVNGSMAPYIGTVYVTYKNMNQEKTTLLVVDNVTDVMDEAPGRLARSLIVLCRDLLPSNLPRPLVPVMAPQIDVRVDYAENFPLAVLCDYEFHDDEPEMALEEEFMQHNVIQKEARILRGEQYILNHL